MKVAVVGLGYVGAVTAACLAANGHDVSGVDVDAAKVDEINTGRSPVSEPGLAEIVMRAVAAGSLHATTSCAAAVDQADVSLVCVGTPSTAQGATDLSHIKHAVNDIAAGLRIGRVPAAGSHTVVIRSTVPPGTVEDVVAPALGAALAGTGLAPGLAMCPEFLREGTGVSDFFAPPFIVAGTADARAADALTTLFGFLSEPVQIVDVRTAEALKYACNAFHATKVSFTNELSRLFRLLGADSRQVMSLFCQDSVLNISPSYLRPGFAFGGSCLPKDVRSLLHLGRVNGADMPLLAGTLATNELVIKEVVDRVVASPAQRVALLGLSFKMATDDLRESPNVEVAERLVGKGYDVRIYDQVVNPGELVGANLRYINSKLPHLSRLLTDSPARALEDADIAVVSAHDPAAVAALTAAPPARVLDLTGRLGADIEALPGYEGLSW
jgi:nucleotide sugar dehydrogenase